jgi:hypothetical protein
MMKIFASLGPEISYPDPAQFRPQAALAGGTMDRSCNSTQVKAAVVLILLILGALVFSARASAAVQPGDLITPKNADKVADLVSPGNLVLVKQGMQMQIIAPGRLEWPPPYKAATEKHSPQVKLDANGEIQNYVAGQPFPLLDPNDPQVATKVMWNFSYSPLYTDDVDVRDVEVASYAPGHTNSADPVAHFTLGHVALYNDLGRVEVAPMPTDPDVKNGVRYRFAAYPFLEPAEIRGFGYVRYRNKDANIEDNSWIYNPLSRRTRRIGPEMLSEAFGMIAGAVGGSTSATNLDPDSYYGFSAKIEDYSYKLIGDKTMLACVHAGSSPAKPCRYDGNRTICPENWEMRRLWVIEANARRNSWWSGPAIPKRILYIDSEGWCITASDQYDREGQLWKTIATFNAYRDRPVPDARVAIYPFKRIFQTAMVDENVQNGFSTVIYTPGREAQDHESWYINMGIITKGFFEPNAMERVGH